MRTQATSTDDGNRGVARERFHFFVQVRSKCQDQAHAVHQRAPCMCKAHAPLSEDCAPYATPLRPNKRALYTERLPRLAAGLRLAKVCTSRPAAERLHVCIYSYTMTRRSLPTVEK